MPGRRCAGGWWLGFLLQLASWCGWTAPSEAVTDLNRLFHVRQWTRADGLPEDQIKVLAQTPDGYLWIGTKSGLVRFDGVTFTRYHRGNCPLFTDDDVRNLAVAAQGDLLVGLVSATVRVQLGMVVEQIAGPSVLPREAILPDATAGVWLRFPRNWLKWTPGQQQPTPGCALEPSLTIHASPDGSYWSVQVGRLMHLHSPDLSLIAEYPLPEQGDKTYMNAAIAAGPDGTLWLLYGDPMRGGGIHLYRITRDGPQEAVSDLKGNGNAPFCPVVDQRGALWYPTIESTLERFRDGQRERFGLTQIPPGEVLSFLQDREGNFWIGTRRRGLFLLEPRQTQSWTASEGLPSDNVRAVLASSLGDVWVGTDNGLARVKSSGDLEAPQATRGLGIRALAEDLAGRLWVGATRGLYVIEGERTRSVPLPVAAFSESDSGRLGSVKIRALLTNRSGSLWVAAAKCPSVLPAGSEQPRAVGTFQDSGILALMEDPDGNVWLGTERFGIAVFGHSELAHADWNALSDVGTTLRPAEPTFYLAPTCWLSVTNGLSSNHAWDFYADRDGVVWVACDNGLNRLDARLVSQLTRNQPPSAAPDLRGGVCVFTTAQGLPDHQINGMVEDDQGRLWFASDHGLFCVSRTELTAVAEGRSERVHAVRLTTADGLPDDETNGRLSHPGATRSADGRLWFPTVRGVVAFDPETVLGNRVRPLVSIEEVRANDRIVFSKDPDALVREGVTNGGSPATPGGNAMPLPGGSARLVAGGGRVLEFHFTALSFEAPAQCRFRYQLAGYEKDWHDVGTRRVAYYTNLDPGAYRFRVQAADTQGNCSEAPAEFGFELAPLVWQTWWFRIGVAGALLLAIAALVRWRIREVRHFEALERQAVLLRERSSIAHDIHDDLGPRLTQLALLTEQVEATTNDGTPARADSAAQQRLAALARDLADTLDGTLWTVEPSGDTLPSFADYLADFATNFLAGTALRLELDIPAHLPPHPLTRQEKRHLFLLVKEALHNVVKHAAAQRVALRLEADAKGFTLEIADDGRGFTVDADGLPAHQHGRRSLRVRAEAIGGQLTLLSAPGQGTTLCLRMPCAVGEASRRP